MPDLLGHPPHRLVWMTHRLVGRLLPILLAARAAGKGLAPEQLEAGPLDRGSFQPLALEPLDLAARVDSVTDAGVPSPVLVSAVPTDAQQARISLKSMSS